MTVISGPDGKTPMLINSVTKEPILDKDGKPLKPNVKNEPAESAATVANKEDRTSILWKGSLDEYQIVDRTAQTEGSSVVTDSSDTASTVKPQTGALDGFKTQEKVF